MTSDVAQLKTAVLAMRPMVPKVRAMLTAGTLPPDVAAAVETLLAGFLALDQALAANG